MTAADSAELLTRYFGDDPESLDEPLRIISSCEGDVPDRLLLVCGSLVLGHQVKTRPLATHETLATYNRFHDEVIPPILVEVG